MPAHGSSDLNILVESERTEYGQVEANKTKGFRKMYLAALCALTFPVAMGMAAAYSATATEDMKRPTSRVIATEDEISWIGSLVAIGALIGGLIAGYLSNKYGRKGTLLLASMPFLVGWVLIAYAPNVWCIFIGRVITGICVGLVCVTAPAYLVEISTPEIRGLLGASFQLFVVSGVLLVTTLGYYLTWNWSAIASAAVVVLALMAMCYVPESPRWLVANGRHQEAIDAVTFLQGEDFDAASECIAINEDLALQPKGRITLREFLQPRVYKPALLSIGLVFFQQACGSNAVLFYTVAIFKNARSSLNPNVASIIVDVVLVAATAVGSCLMDRAGRKVLLITSSLGMALSLFILGVYEFEKILHKALASNYSWIPLVCIMIYVAAFSLGFGPIPWLMMAEMSPVRTRSFIGGMATAVCWLFVFIVTKTFDSLLHFIDDYGAFWLYGGFSVLASVFSWLLLPETKGKPIEAIQEFFQSPRLL